MISCRRLHPALHSRANKSLLRRNLAAPSLLISSTPHHGHNINHALLSRGNSFHSRRAITRSVDGIKVARLGLATAQNNPNPHAQQHYNSRRQLSRTLDADFDVPALDLMTPSLSIPLPPNLLNKNAKEVSPPTSSSASDEDEMIAVPPLYSSSRTWDAPRRPRKDTERVPDSLSLGRGLHLDQSVERIKNRLAFGTNTQEATPAPSKRALAERSSHNKKSNGIPVSRSEKLRHALQKMKITQPDGKKSNDATVPSRHHDTSTWDNNLNRLEVSFDDQFDEHLPTFKENVTANMLDMYPSRTGNAPQITGGRSLDILNKLNKNIEDAENAWLKCDSTEEKMKISRGLRHSMIRLRMLQECGITPTQYKRMTRKKLWSSSDERKSVLLIYQSKYYEENARPEPHKGWDITEDDTPVSKSTMRPSSRDPSEFPFPDFRGDVITTQANGTILACSGSTSVLSTVVLGAQDTQGEESGSINDSEQSTAESLLLTAIQQADAQSGATFVPLQVDYRERYHASGKIPSNIRRRDNSGPLSDREVLAARVIDRTVRPWLMMGLASTESASSCLLPENIVVNCEVQSYNPQPIIDQSDEGMPQSTQRTHADPIALAINSTIAALYQAAYSSSNASFPVPLEAAACVKLAILRDGKTVFDPTPKELEECKLELLYAGTKDRVLMLEFSSNAGLPRGVGINEHSVEDPGIDESTVADAIRLAHESILPLVEKQEELRENYSREFDARALEKDEALMTDREVAQLLGLESPMAGLDANEVYADPIHTQSGMEIIDEAKRFVWSKVAHVALKLFGYDGVEETDSLVERTAHIHKGTLLAKKVRGRRENVLQSEIARVLREEFVPCEEEVALFYRSALENSEILCALTNHIHEKTMKKAMVGCAKRKLRSDGRCGLNVVRPISTIAPILPDSVHGSALFSRGETQVMCTATVGAPKEGLPIIGPYAVFPEDCIGKSDGRSNNEKVPVGSLRFLRNQAEMESDMNSRKVLAGREMTGDSGVFSEVKRAFLHYDFPDFSTGAVRSKAGGSANRRAIGHGNLAEKAILPVLPHLNDFPYTIRLTSEVTSSNGSSSMASACGSSLALLDAGVPLISPVAGVSVGLAPSSDELLLDITGTEDHYGDMDFKICGTYGGVTAMQLDVKQPLKMATVTNALDLAKEGRKAILDAMENECKNTLPGLQPRISLKSTAPRVEIVRFDPNRKRDLIGPGGSVLRQLEDRFQITLDLSQDGQCLIFGALSSVSQAKNVIMDLVSDVEEGGVYEGTVIEIKDFGAVVELLRNKEGLLHVSEIANTTGRHPGGNIGLVKDHLKVGDKIEVLCTKIDHVQGSIKLSRKKLLQMRTNNFETVTPTATYHHDTVLEDAVAEITGIANNDSEDEDDTGVNISHGDSSDNDRSIYNLGSGNNEDFREDSEILKTVNPVLTLEASWMERYNELMQYNSINGDCNIPRGYHENPELGKWVNMQRSLFKKGSMLDERAQLLDDIGFMWSNASSLEASWMERYNELMQYKITKGDCNVPGRYYENPKLGMWVNTQRKLFKKGSMLDDRAQLLDDIGFRWINTNASSLEARWMERYNELMQYNSIKGDCNVPGRYHENPELGMWVNKQRSLFKKGSMLDNRVQLLDDIGFMWFNTHAPSLEARWMERYNELMQYKIIKGDCNVPGRYHENPELGRWVNKQRGLFKKGSMLDNRAQHLNDIGFSWSLVKLKA